MNKNLVIYSIVILFLTACEDNLQQNEINTTQPNKSSTNSGNPQFTTSHFSGSQTCSLCHNGIYDQNGVDVSVEKDWNSTMMANSARDPLFRAKLASEISRNPGLKSTIEKKCSRCHTPMANVQAQINGEAVAMLSPGFLDPNNSLFNIAMDGVSCTLCHQMENNATLGAAAGFSGNYSIGNDRKIYGPISNPFTMPMERNVNFTPQYSAHISTSELCSSCHNLLTDVVDSATGQLTGQKFPEQMIYSEWENSEYALVTSKKSCQDCHMPETNGVRVSSQGMMMAGARNNFSKHYFVGANTFMLDILNRNKTQLGVIGNNFNTTIQRTRETLQSAASVQINNTSSNSGVLSFDVNIQNNTGHKLPGGYPARRVYLHVTITDSNNNIVFESGKLNADGSIVGVDSDINAQNFEAHYDMITNSDQVQVYEAIMANTQGQVTYTLLNGASYIKDNRLLPKGFNKNIVSTEIKPSNDAMQDNDYSAGQDTVTYQVPVTGTGPYMVSIELNYQSVAYRYVQDLFRDANSHEYISMFKTFYDNSQIRKETISATSVVFN